jgi:hypothetical protein
VTTTTIKERMRKTHGLKNGVISALVGCAAGVCWSDVGEGGRATTRATLTSVGR